MTEKRWKGGYPQQLVDWYNGGADGAINWGEDGDFEACVAIAGKYIDNPEGFCNERHQDATGAPPGHAPGESEDKKDAPTGAELRDSASGHQHETRDSTINGQATRSSDVAGKFSPVMVTAYRTGEAEHIAMALKKLYPEAYVAGLLASATGDPNSPIAQAIQNTPVLLALTEDLSGTMSDVPATVADATGTDWEAAKGLLNLLSDATESGTNIAQYIGSDGAPNTEAQATQMATTESANGAEAGAQDAASAAGYSQMQSVPDDGACSICQDKAGNAYDIGDDGPPWHPSCGCESQPAGSADNTEQTSALGRHVRRWKEKRDWAEWDAEHYGDAKPSLTVGDKSYTEFFHGTDAVLKPGDIVTPGKETGKSQFDKVSLATHPGDAKHYGEHVYRVTPQNDLTQGRIVRDGRPTAYTGKAIVQEELQGVEEKKTDLERIADGEDPDYVRKTTGVSRSEYYFADRATSAETIARVEAHVRRNTLAWEERDWAEWDLEHPYVPEGKQGGGGGAIKEYPDSHIEPVSFLQGASKDYAEKTGIEPTGHVTDFQSITADPTRGTEIGDAYKALPLDDPAAHASYDALASEVGKQYEYMTGTLGIKVDVQATDPYPSVKEMVKDVQDNHHISVLSTETTGAHPYFSNEQNDQFRAVHDVFGHAATGRGFDRNGEEAAWTSHSQMFSAEARPAMTSETCGQNSAMVWGDGQFQPQKVALLPQQYIDRLLKMMAELRQHDMDDHRDDVVQAQADADNLYHVGHSHHASNGRHFPKDYMK